MLEQFMQTYAKALASQDWNEVEPLIHDDACVQFSEGTYVGKANVKLAFEKAFALIQDEQYAISNLRWVEASEVVAVCLYDFAWSGLVHGQETTGAGRGTSVLKRERGTWQLLVEHLGPSAS